MPIRILMPALSPTMEEGTLAKWLVKEGDAVQSGDILAEIETDKATMEFETVDDGIVGQILVREGTAGVAVNTPIAVLLEDGESAQSEPEPDTAPSDPAPQPALDTPSGQTDTGIDKAPTHAAGLTEALGAAPGAKEGDRIFASPLARRIAAQNDLSLADIAGTGPRGRIVKADVEAALASPQPALSPRPDHSAAPEPIAPRAADASAIVSLYADREHTEITLDGMRRTIAARLTEAKQTIPHFYLRRSVRLDALLGLRSEINAQLASRGIKLSVNDFVIKACAQALQQVPTANAVWAGDRILQLVPSDIAVAVAVEGGLFTPVLKDAHAKPLSALSAEMADLASRARDRKLAPQEYQGGSFAISNLGMYGIESFDAVINPPHGAILAVGAGARKPVVTADGDVSVATMMSLTLSVDHRVIDGTLGAELLAAIASNLEAPIAMLA